MSITAQRGLKLWYSRNMDISHEGVKDPMFYASHVERYCTLNDNCTSRSWSRFRRIYVPLVYLLFRHFRQTSYFTLHTIMSFTESENWLALFESVSRISKSKGAELDQESDEKRKQFSGSFIFKLSPGRRYHTSTSCWILSFLRRTTWTLKSCGLTPTILFIPFARFKN